VASVLKALEEDQVGKRAEGEWLDGTVLVCYIILESFRHLTQVDCLVIQPFPYCYAD